MFIDLTTLSATIDTIANAISIATAAIATFRATTALTRRIRTRITRARTRRNRTRRRTQRRRGQAPPLAKASAPSPAKAVGRGPEARDWPVPFRLPAFAVRMAMGAKRTLPFTAGGNTSIMDARRERHFCGHGRSISQSPSPSDQGWLERSG